jgi:DNA-binding transcriptional LysR family regulator
MRNLNLDQLRTLLEVVELGSFSAAARRLNLTQPAVSLQIRELERRFGVRLIERLGKRAHTTAPGATLVEAARRIFHECDLIDAAMRPYRDGWIGRVQIGATNTMLVHVLPPILRELSREHPGIDLHVTNMPTRESVERILQNRLDLALVTLPVQKRHLRITPLLPEQLVAIFPRPRDLPDEVTPEFAARQPLLMEHTGGAVYALVVRWLSGLGSLPRPPMHLGTIEALRSAVASNLGYRAGDRGRRPSPGSSFARPQLSRTLALIEHRNKPNEPALEIVRNALLALRTDRDTGIDRKRRGPEESPAALRARRSTRRPRRNSALT